MLYCQTNLICCTLHVIFSNKQNYYLKWYDVYSTRIHCQCHQDIIIFFASLIHLFCICFVSYFIFCNFCFDYSDFVTLFAVFLALRCIWKICRLERLFLKWHLMLIQQVFVFVLLIFGIFSIKLSYTCMKNKNNTKICYLYYHNTI